VNVAHIDDPREMLSNGPARIPRDCREDRESKAREQDRDHGCQCRVRYTFRNVPHAYLFVCAPAARSESSGEQQQDDDDQEKPTDAGRPVAIGVESQVGEATHDDHEEQDEQDDSHEVE
jgi:hypothetical protein